MADTLAEAIIEPEHQEAFREVLQQVPRTLDVAHLVGLCFDAGVRSERTRLGYVSLPQRVEELVAVHGVRGLARMLRVDPGYISRLRTGGRQNPVDEILTQMGLRRVVLYERIDRGVTARGQP